MNGTNPIDADTDGDGMPDGWEAFYDLNPRDSKDANEDLDLDGYDSNRDTFVSNNEKFTNYEEFLNDCPISRLIRMEMILLLLVVFPEWHSCSCVIYMWYNHFSTLLNH